VPIGRDRTYWFASENTPEGGRSPEGERQHLLRKLEHWHAPIPKLIAATDDQGILRHDIYDRTTISAWSNGPVVVIGDAAHPMRPHMGQGGCQSIEDGVLLAASIGAHPSISSALAEFSQKRARRVHTIVRQSALMGRVIQGEGPIAAATRHLGSRIPMRLLVRSLTRVGGRDAFDHESAGFPTFSE
jgi:2-polyprenyl-6-methoxyphenol hydroxylase-like FAD-dependent oxidoreductase